MVRVLHNGLAPSPRTAPECSCLHTPCQMDGILPQQRERGAEQRDSVYSIKVAVIIRHGAADLSPSKPLPQTQPLITQKHNPNIATLMINEHYKIRNSDYWHLTLPMLRLLSSKTQESKNLWKPSKPCHVGTHLIALSEYSQMSTHMPGFRGFLRFLFALFCIG